MGLQLVVEDLLAVELHSTLGLAEAGLEARDSEAHRQEERGQVVVLDSSASSAQSARSQRRSGSEADPLRQALLAEHPTYDTSTASMTTYPRLHATDILAEAEVDGAPNAMAAVLLVDVHSLAADIRAEEDILVVDADHCFAQVLADMVREVPVAKTYFSTG